MTRSDNSESSFYERNISQDVENVAKVRIINANARSLRPKIASLVDKYNELDITFGLITETWFNGGERHEKEVEDLLLGSGITMLTQNREPGTAGVAHGGVAVFARSSVTRLAVFPFPNPESFEVLPCSAKLHGVEGSFHIIAAYIPPGYAVGRARACMQHISDVILQMKERDSEARVVLGGDFNQWNVAEYLLDYPDINEALTTATRGDKCIDKIFVNFDYENAVTMPPLESAPDREGIRHMSDHLSQLLTASIEKKPLHKWHKFSVRPFTEEGKQAFLTELRSTDWSDVIAADGTNSKANKLQLVLDHLMDDHFPVKTIRRRDCDLPWINDTARKKIRKKKRVFFDEGDSPRWHALREDLDRYLEGRRQKFLEKQRENLTSPGASKQFYKNVRNFNSIEKPKSFDIHDLLPNKSDAEAAEEVASYFNRISAEFRPLQPDDIPRSYDRPMPLLSHAEVAARLRKAKKPNSMVPGDVFPKLISDSADSLAVPLTSIYNSIITSWIWPVNWKREYVTVIPKKSMPQSLGDLRNISCTKFFSKVFEAYLLENMLAEIKLKDNQYGGVKGRSTGHMLLDIWQEIAENAEDYRSATVLTSLDYAKAFNRMSFQHCLQALRAKGASNPIIRLVATFLTNRSMTVRVGGVWSKPREVSGGCPQGSILGVILFNLTTDDLEDEFLRAEQVRLGAQLPPSPPRPEPAENVPDQPCRATSTPLRPIAPPRHDLSPVGRASHRLDGRLVQILANARNVPDAVLQPVPHEEGLGTQVLTRKPVKIVKYVDDSISCEKLNFARIPITMLAGMPVKIRIAMASQNAFRSVVVKAERKGMVVNADKTNILCISDALNYTPKTFIVDADGNEIHSRPAMKILGFNFSEKPTVAVHAEETIKKIRQKIWSLRHLKGVGFTESELVRVYKSNLLPIADYCCYVYHSMLNDDQDERLERAQVGALRAIFGYKLSGRKLREKAGVETLRDRRIRLTDNFARKAAADAHFSGKWFPKKTARASLRSAASREEYREEYARCDRLRNSPIFYMRRRLNNKVGKEYGQRNREFRQ